MENKIEIFPLTESEVTQAAALERVCFSSPWSEAMIREAAARDEMVFLAAYVKGAFAGYASMLCVLDEGQICNIAVARLFRRHGVGRALIDALIEEGKRRSLATLMLEVRESNAAAQALYEAVGFVRDGVRRAFYSAPREDAFLYHFDLKIPGPETS